MRRVVTAGTADVKNHMSSTVGASAAAQWLGAQAGSDQLGVGGRRDDGTPSHGEPNEAEVNRVKARLVAFRINRGCFTGAQALVARMQCKFAAGCESVEFGQLGLW